MQFRLGSTLLFLLLVGCSPTTGHDNAPDQPGRSGTTVPASATGPGKEKQPASGPAVAEPKTAEEAVKLVKDLGGDVNRDFPRGEGKEVKLNLSKVQDSDLKGLALIPNVTSLDLSHTGVSDAGLKHVVALKDLKVLYLSDTKVTDAGLKELADLKGLEQLFLDDTKVTDVGLKDLASGGDSQLKLLYLGNTKITDAGLKDLARFKKLSELSLDGTAITDAGMKEVGSIPDLHSLWIWKTNVTDEGLNELHGCKELTSVYVSSTNKKITPAGIDALKKAQSLVNVKVSDN